MGCKDFTIDHSSSIQGSVTVTCKVDTSWSLGDAESTTTIYSNVWPKQANLTGATDFNDEQNPTITYSNQAGTNVDSLQVRIENTAGSVAYVGYKDVSKTSNSFTFSLTESERNTLRSACSTNSLGVKFVLRTIISGNTYYSTINKTMTLVNANPTFNDFTFADTNATTVALTGNNQYNVNGYSNITATISTTNKATANKQASMSKYRFTIGNAATDITYSSNSDVSGTINNAVNGTYTVYAIDSRNNSTPVTKLATQVIQYSPLYINPTTTSVVRDNNQIGTNAVLTINGTFWNDNFGQITNTIKSVSYRIKKSNSSTWAYFITNDTNYLANKNYYSYNNGQYVLLVEGTDYNVGDTISGTVYQENGTTPITLTTSNNDFTFTGLIASDNQDTSWDLSDSYNVRITITDELSTATIDLLLNSGVPTLCLDKNGVGIMCAYDSSIGGYLQVNGVKII